MSSTAPKLNDATLQMFVYASILFLLFLVSENITNFISPKKVLGVQAEVLNVQVDNSVFWNEFLSRNPNYAPGWEEIGRTDRVRGIDPNWK